MLFMLFGAKEGPYMDSMLLVNISSESDCVFGALWCFWVMGHVRGQLCILCIGYRWDAWLESSSYLCE
jgi:hypothetical protein